MEVTESKVQQDCFVWLNNNYGMKKHEPRLVMFSVPNEVAMAIRSVLIGLKLNKKLVDQAVSIVLKKIKNTGFITGVSDTIVLLPNGVTLFVEFKTDKGYQSDDQKEFQSRLDNIGHKYYVCRSLESFQEIIESELFPSLSLKKDY